MKRVIGMIAAAAMVVMAMALAGCSAGANSSAASSSGLPNGEYSATFHTDSTMFHINEADDGRGVLTVADDGMTIHIHLTSKKITNLYYGTAADAKNDEANLIQPTTDTVTYKDGASEEVYGFDVPVPALDEEFNVAIIGQHGNWYDHKVSVTDPVAL